MKCYETKTNTHHYMTRRQNALAVLSLLGRGPAGAAEEEWCMMISPFICKHMHADT